MQKFLIALAFGLAACDGTATKKDDATSHDPNPETSGFVEVAERDLFTTPYMTEWKLNEVYADTTDLPGVVGVFAFEPLAKSELKIGFDEVQVTECALPGGANPAFVIERADGTKAVIGKEEAFVVDAQEPVKIRVSMPNVAHCHSVDVLFGVNLRAL